MLLLYPVSLRNEVAFEGSYHQENVRFHKEQGEGLLLEKLELLDSLFISEQWL